MVMDRRATGLLRSWLSTRQDHTWLWLQGDVKLYGGMVRYPAGKALSSAAQRQTPIRYHQVNDGRTTWPLPQAARTIPAGTYLRSAKRRHSTDDALARGRG